MDATRLLVDWPDTRHKLIVAVAARVGTGADSIAMLLDTASEFCVISRSEAVRLGWEDSLDLSVQKINTRLGDFIGLIDRLDVTFIGNNREELLVDATWLIIEDWPGPTVLGWRGCLERMRFDIDPLDNWFYFAAA